MPEVDLDHLENRLLEERKQTLDRIRQAESEGSEGQRMPAGELSRIPLHLGDAASDTQESEKDAAVISRGTRRLNLIDSALRLIRDDPVKYRTCEECGRAIADARLDLIPWVRRCASCVSNNPAGPDRVA